MKTRLYNIRNILLQKFGGGAKLRGGVIKSFLVKMGANKRGGSN